MRKLSSLASRAVPQIQHLAERIQIPKKPRNPSPSKLKSRQNISQNRVVSSTGKLELKESSFASISGHKSHISDRDQRFKPRVIDHRYLAEILSRKDWFLLLNHEFDADRGNLNAQIVVSVLQNQENVICALRFYVWMSNFSALLGKNQMIRSALGNALYRKGPVLLSAELIQDIRNSGCRVSEDLLCALIGSWGRLGLAKYCSEVFEQVSYLGITPSTRLYNAVIDGLVKSNSLDLAYLKFQRMEVDNCIPDRFTYNILIHGVCKAGVVDEALRLVKQMEGLGYSPNVFTYTILMDGYFNAKSTDEAFRLLETMKARKVRPNEATYRSLINGVFGSASPLQAFELLSRWVNSEPNLPKVVYDSIIYKLCDNSLAKQAAEFLRTADERGYVPDSSISNIVMTCLIKGLDLEEVCQVFEYFIKRRVKVKVDLSTCLTLVEALYKSMKEEKGNRYLSWILQEGLVNSVFSYNMVIDCFCRAEMMHRAVETLGMMTKRGVLPNLVTFNTLIAGYCKSRDVLKAREMLLILFDRGFKPDVFTFSSIIDGLCQVNQNVDAFDCLIEMVEWGITPNAVTYNSLIRSLCISGNVSKAMKLLRKMQIDGIQPDIYTFNALIKKYCKDHKIDKAQRLLKSMLKLGLRPDNFTYVAFINVLCESGRFHEAKDLLTSMEMNGCRPDAYTCNSFIDALVKSGRSQEAIGVWLKYKEKGLALKPVPVRSGTLRSMAEVEIEGSVSTWRQFNMALWTFMTVKKLSHSSDENRALEGFCRKLRLVYGSVILLLMVKKLLACYVWKPHVGNEIDNGFQFHEIIDYLDNRITLTKSYLFFSNTDEAISCQIRTRVFLCFRTRFQMAFSASTLLVAVLLYIFVCSCKFGTAYDYPHLGAAGVVANQYLPKAEDEGETDQYFPQAGIVGITPALIFKKAIGCLKDNYIYSSCEEAHRLTENGELHVPPDYTDEYCKGPCLEETKHALDCMGGILKGFVFLNKATLDNVRDTLESGCGYGPQRGSFDVLEHIQANDAGEKPASNVVVYASLVVVAVWRLLHSC
ncbi:pentatricopeptide domain protein 40 [Perilla frutescens var. frutescens]|nr:pentatricopeptide domain protein 40 [Perilla frutescens var. frutescens]